MPPPAACRRHHRCISNRKPMGGGGGHGPWSIHCPWLQACGRRRRRPWSMSMVGTIAIIFWLDVFACVRMCLAIAQTHPNTFKHIQTHSNTSKHIQTHSNTSKHIQKYAFSRWSFGLANWFLSKDESFWIEPNGWACFLVRRRSRLYLRRLYEY